MTERDNFYEMIHHTGKAQWLPLIDELAWFGKSSVDRDRPVIPEAGFDWFGCHWTFDFSVDGYAPTPSYGPVLEDICDWKEIVKFPDLEMINWEAAAKADMEGVDRDSKIVFMWTESGPFERVHQLMGMEETFIAMYEEPEAFKELMEALTDFRIRFYDKLINYYDPDVVTTMDDLGSSHAAMFSLPMYRELIRPYDQKIIDYIHSRGKLVCYHSCGCMQDFAGDLVEMGVDIIHPLQGGINDEDRLQEEYGDKVCFFGGLDNKVHLMSTSEEELKEEMNRVIHLFWKKKNLIILPGSFNPGYSEILYKEAKKEVGKMKEGDLS